MRAYACTHLQANEVAARKSAKHFLHHSARTSPEKKISLLHHLRESDSSHAAKQTAKPPTVHVTKSKPVEKPAHAKHVHILHHFPPMSLAKQQSDALKEVGSVLSPSVRNRLKLALHPKSAASVSHRVVQHTAAHTLGAALQRARKAALAKQTHAKQQPRVLNKVHKKAATAKQSGKNHGTLLRAKMKTVHAVKSKQEVNKFGNIVQGGHKHLQHGPTTSPAKQISDALKDVGSVLSPSVRAKLKKVLHPKSAAKKVAKKSGKAIHKHFLQHSPPTSLAKTYSDALKEVGNVLSPSVRARLKLALDPKSAKSTAPPTMHTLAHTLQRARKAALAKQQSDALKEVGKKLPRAVRAKLKHALQPKNATTPGPIRLSDEIALQKRELKREKEKAVKFEQEEKSALTTSAVHAKPNKGHTFAPSFLPGAKTPSPTTLASFLRVQKKELEQQKRELAKNARNAEKALGKEKKGGHKKVPHNMQHNLHAELERAKHAAQHAQSHKQPHKKQRQPASTGPTHSWQLPLGYTSAAPTVPPVAKTPMKAAVSGTPAPTASWQLPLRASNAPQSAGTASPSHSPTKALSMAAIKRKLKAEKEMAKAAFSLMRKSTVRIAFQQLSYAFRVI